MLSSFLGLLSGKLKTIIKGIFGYKFEKINKNPVTLALVFGILATISFLLYSATKDRELVRLKIGDLEYDMMQSIYSKYPSSPTDTPKIVVILIDKKYIDKKGLSDGYGGIRFNFTPRYVLADILKSFNKTADGVSPKALLLDYYLENPSNVNEASKDDEGLINTLNLLAKNHPVYLPTLKNSLFIEDFKLNKNVKLISTLLDINEDGIVRGYQPYTCKDGKVVPSVVLLGKDLPSDFQCGKEAETLEDKFKHRILFKSIDENYLSNYKNISIYSAYDLLGLNYQIPSSEFEDAVVIIGSNYQSSSDTYSTPIGKMSGALILANAITSSYKDDIKELNLWLGAIYYFILGTLGSFVSMRLINRFYQSEINLVWFAALQVAMAIVFFIPSAFLFFTHRIYIAWILPWFLFQFLEFMISILSAFNKSSILKICRLFFALSLIAILTAIISVMINLSISLF